MSKGQGDEGERRVHRTGVDPDCVGVTRERPSEVDETLCRTEGSWFWTGEGHFEVKGEKRSVV
jgi:hypothetical protein